MAAAVAGEEEGFVLLVVDGEGEHAVELGREVGAPFEPGGGEDFGVAAGVELVAFFFKDGAEFLPVVYFAVADGVDVMGGEGLVAMFEVEDGEAGHAKGEGGAVVGACSIGSAVVEGGEHGCEDVS